MTSLAIAGGMVDEDFVVFDCRGAQCVGVLTQPPSGAAARRLGVVIVVGGPQTRVGSHRQFVSVARALANAGVSAFRFDCRGMGDSEGEMRSFESIDDDIAAAVDRFTQLTRVKRVVLWGLCDAASASLMYAPADRRIAGIVALNPWARSPSGEASVRLRHYYRDRALSKAFWRKVLKGELSLRQSAADFAHAVRARGRSQRDRLSYLERMDQALESFGRPLLLILSGRDLTAREFEAWVAADARRGARLSDPSVERRTIPDADHTFSARACEDLCTQLTLRWIEALGDDAS